MESQELRPNSPNKEHLVHKKELSIWEALIPVIALIIMLYYNVRIYGADALDGSNQFVLLLGAAIAVIVGFMNKIRFSVMIQEVAENIRSTAGAILILLLVGSLAGTWLISGVIPTMVYYGLQVLNPTIFLASSVIICSIVSLATGSSWTTSATVGIALVGIAEALNIPLGMAAGAVISGAYFGDKLSPLSDTTNLAPAMAGTDLFTHIRYMLYTTIPSLTVTLIVFIVIGLNLDVSGTGNTDVILQSISETVNVSPWLFLVPLVVIFLIVRKTPPLIALLLGTLLGGLAALIFQPEIVSTMGESTKLTFSSGYKGVMNAITTESFIPTSNEMLQDLFTAGGMVGMLPTIWLILCAMTFGGVMDAIGALSRISKSLLNLFHSTFGLFASTVASCLALNITASDQYLAIVVPGKMYAQAFEDKGLAPENLSRTLEDSGTVTSALIPWNTCGAYQSGVLGVDTLHYAAYAIFNWISPFMTLLFAAFRIKIRELSPAMKA